MRAKESCEYIALGKSSPISGTHGRMFISITCQLACLIMASEDSPYLSVCLNGREEIGRILAVSATLSHFLLSNCLPVLVMIGFSWLFRPFAYWFMRSAKKTMTSPNAMGLILCSRVALNMWEGVRETNWTFLSPPWQLRDKGNLNRCIRWP